MPPILNIDPSRPIWPIASPSRVVSARMGSDIFERLSGNLSRRPVGMLLQRVGIPVRHNSFTDKALHACLQGALAGVLSKPLSVVFGMQPSVMLCSLLAVFFVYQWTTANGLFNAEVQDGR